MPSFSRLIQTSRCGLMLPWQSEWVGSMGLVHGNGAIEYLTGLVPTCTFWSHEDMPPWIGIG